jgi:dTMP kinase
MPRGLLITIEGLDGAGKSTLARSLAEHLAAAGLPVQLLREPGGVEVSERIRALLLEPGLPVSPRAEALLYAAARAQLAEQLLEPLLAAGTILLLDRFADSSLAYQGAGRGLPVEQIAAVNRFALAGLQADLTLLLDVPAELGRRRKGAGGQAPDRLELEDEAFFERIADAYRRLARAEPERIHTIDARAAPGEVLQAALLAISPLFPGATGGGAI